jgi:hypothetical protein
LFHKEQGEQRFHIERGFGSVIALHVRQLPTNELGKIVVKPEFSARRSWPPDKVIGPPGSVVHGGDSRAIPNSYHVLVEGWIDDRPLKCANFACAILHFKPDMGLDHRELLTSNLNSIGHSVRQWHIATSAEHPFEAKCVDDRLKARRLPAAIWSTKHSQT